MKGEMMNTDEKVVLESLTLQEIGEDQAVIFQGAEKAIVVVTGSAGLIGSKVVEALSANFRVVGLDVEPLKQEVKDAEWIECDMTRDESVAQALAKIRSQYGEKLASVIHLAGYYDFSGAPSPLYRTLTVEGTQRLLRTLQQFQVEQFVFSSSLLVMEPGEPDHLINEQSPTIDIDEAWDYPRSKIEAERVIRREAGAIPTVILRVAGVYDETGHSIPIAQQIRRIHEEKLESYFFPGDVHHGQAFVHLSDLIDCIRQVVELRHELDAREVFLIAEPDVMNYAELQEQLGELIHGEQWPTIRIPKAVAKAGAWAQEKIFGEESFIKPWMVDMADQHYPVEIARARERLGWMPEHRLRDTLSSIVGRLKENPQKWYEANHLAQPEKKAELSS
jgi:nucleoside-diphosphate-sugar epimerase